MIYFLEFDEIIFLHESLIKKFGGSAGLRDKNLLESALAYPQFLSAMVPEQDLYVLASAYCYHIIGNHPFLDGNKRIGVLAMLTFLKMNKMDIHVQKDKLYNLAMDIAMSKIPENQVAKKLKIIVLKYQK